MDHMGRRLDKDRGRSRDVDRMYQAFQDDTTREVVDRELSKWVPDRHIHGPGRVWEVWPQIL